MNNKPAKLPINECKVIDRVIDIYLWCDDLNTHEVILLGQKLIDLANRRATDVELVYFGVRKLVEDTVVYSPARNDEDIKLPF